MYKINQLFLASLTLFIVFSSFKAEQQDTEKEEVREAIQYYLQAHATGNGEYLREAFHPVANLYFVRDSELAQYTLEEYIALFDGTPGEDEDQRIRSIDNIEISGNAAIVTITLDYPNGIYTDYMSMLKIDGQWKIVNKTFYIDPR
ncbi:MAG: nuclear transport factor 2 family protein [Balneolaceae bacterium]|nr:nuclear transport factor 2 family protein [Balneolaceae bacterium]